MAIKHVNLNDLAKTIALKEGKKFSLNIGQIKEVMRLVFKELAGMTNGEVMTIIRRYRNKD